jgi:hypothetical protein
VQRVTSWRVRRPTAPRRGAPAHTDESAAERLGDGRDRGPQEHPATPDGLRVPRGRSHRRADPRPHVRGGGATLGELDKLAAQESKRVLGDAELAERAERLSNQYFDGRARPVSVRWVTNQNTRWGSCTPSEGSIRLSHRLQGMPEYVVDYVLLHELAHLLVPGHGPRFWRLLEAYPRTERARGYLEGVVAADRLPHVPGARNE